MAPARKDWTGGTIYAKSFNFLYGSIEARIKSAGNGVHSGLLWMMASGCQPIMYRHSNWCNQTWPNPNNEIDIAEIKPASGGLTTVYQNFLGDAGKWHDGSGRTTDVSRNWHVYRLDWSPSSLVFSIDGVATTTFTTEIPYRPMFPIVSTEFEDGSGGVPNPAAFPQTIQVDYVRVWNAAGKLIFSDEFFRQTIEISGPLWRTLQQLTPRGAGSQRPVTRWVTGERAVAAFSRHSGIVIDPAPLIRKRPAPANGLARREHPVYSGE